MATRRATEADIETLVDLRLQFVTEARELQASELTDEFRAATRGFIESGVSTGVLHSWLAERDEHPVGIVSMLLLQVPPRPEDPRRFEGYILNMYVRPRARRERIGQNLLDECLAATGPLGVRRVFLHATEDARTMYEGFGFAPNDDWLELRLAPNEPGASGPTSTGGSD